MLALADWADDNGRCWPSVAAIARKVNLTEKQARRVIHGLIEDGYVRVTDNAQGGATSRRYQIRLDRLTPPADGSSPIQGSPPPHVPTPSHGREPTSPPHGSRTIIDTSVTVKEDAQASPATLFPMEIVKFIPPCPTEKLVEIYHQTMPLNPQVKNLSKTRRAAIAARWKEAATLNCKPFGYSDTDKGLQSWRTFFEICAESLFLTGRAQPQPGKPPFVADIDFLMSPSGFTKTLENKYHREAA
jgi:hypothetical protein